MKKVVVDASIAVKWAINENDSHVALALLTNCAATEVVMIAPTLLISEVTNILYRAVKRGALPYEDAKLSLKSIIFPALTLDMVNVCLPDFFLNVIEQTNKFNLPATYDAHYLALAEREQCEFWTADKRLYNSVKGQLSWVRLMSDLASVSVSD